MAKNKQHELLYKIEGLKRMVKRKVKRGKKCRANSLAKQLRILTRDDEDWYRY